MTSIDRGHVGLGLRPLAGVPESLGGRSIAAGHLLLESDGRTTAPAPCSAISRSVSSWPVSGERSDDGTPERQPEIRGCEVG